MKRKSAATDKESYWQDSEPSVGKSGGAKCLHLKKKSRGGARTPSDTWWDDPRDERSSLSLMSVSTASCSQWTISCGGCPPIMEKDQRRTA